MCFSISCFVHGTIGPRGAAGPPLGARGARGARGRHGARGTDGTRWEPGYAKLEGQVKVMQEKNFPCMHVEDL